ncbi:MAG: hypothetical protein SNJ71_02515 [Bacteroidales bacterium]
MLGCYPIGLVHLFCIIGMSKAHNNKRGGAVDVVYLSFSMIFEIRCQDF